MSPTFRLATPADADRLAALAARTFTDAYGSFNTPEDIATYLAAHFTAARQAEELADPRAAVILAEEEGELVGYARIVVGSEAPACVRSAAPVELARLYVRAGRQRGGIGAELLARAVAEARRRGGATLWLTVWEHNTRAIAFYRREGLREAGETVFMLGADAQRDHVMALDLRGAR